MRDIQEVSGDGEFVHEGQVGVEVEVRAVSYVEGDLLSQGIQQSGARNIGTT